MVEVVLILAVAVTALFVMRGLLGSESPSPPRVVARARSAPRVEAPVALGGRPRSRGETSTRLFGYAVRATGPTVTGYRHNGIYASVAIATTGLSPSSERIVELSVVRSTADGRVLDSWSTVLDPGTDEVGLSAVHGLTGRDTAGAPTFVDVAGHFVARLGGAVVVAHNAEFVEEFLLNEFLRAGLLAPSAPAVSMNRLAQLSLRSANHRLGTVAAGLRVSSRPDGTAVTEAALLAATLPRLLLRQEDALVYPLPPLPQMPIPPSVGRARTASPSAGSADPWLNGLLQSMSISALEVHDPRAGAFMEMLVVLLGRGHVVTKEVSELVGSAVRSGFSTAAVRQSMERFCELLRQVAFATTPSLGPSHLRHLRAVAASAGLAGYFDDLIPPAPAPAPAPGSGSFARPVRKPLPPPPPTHEPRCGRCMGVGHYASQCPRAGRGAGRGVPPIDPIAPV